MTQGCTETIPLTKKPTRPEFSTSCPPHTPYNMHPSLKLVDSRPTRAHRPKHGTRRHRPGTVQWALQHLATARAPQGGFYTLSMLGDEEAPRAGDSPSRRHDGPAPRTDSYNSKAARSKLTCPVAAQERPVRQNKTWVCGGIQRAQRPSGARDTPLGWWRFCWRGHAGYAQGGDFSKSPFGLQTASVSSRSSTSSAKSWVLLCADHQVDVGQPQSTLRTRRERAGGRRVGHPRPARPA